MPYTPHAVQKGQKISAAFVPLIQEKLFLPSLFHHQSIDEFKGTQGDTISIHVPGKLPAHDYDFRNDRSKPLILDTFKERKVDLTMGGNAYSAVEITDEQAEFDLVSWGKVLPMQAEAVAQHLNHQALRKFQGLEHPVTLGVTPDVGGNVRRALQGAKLVLDKFQVAGNRYLFVGSEFESAILNDPTITMASVAGDAAASEAVREATVGRVGGFTVMSVSDLAPDEAIAAVDTGLVWAGAAPKVPNSVAYGTTVSEQGLSLRHILDYDTMYLRDRSVVNTWYGFGVPKDVYVNWTLKPKGDANGMDTTTPTVIDGEFYARSIKLKLGAANAFTGAAGLTTGTGVNKAFLDRINKQVAPTAAPTTPPAG